MKRINSLTGTILGTIVNSVQVLINFYSLILLFAIIPNLDGSNASMIAFTVLTSILLMAVLVVAFVLTLLTFKYVNGTPELYRKKRATTIATIVFDVLVVILLFAGGISDNALSTVINVICALILVASVVLYIVDLCLEDKRVEKVKQQENNNVEGNAEVKEEKPAVEEETIENNEKK